MRLRLLSVVLVACSFGSVSVAKAAGNIATGVTITNVNAGTQGGDNIALTFTGGSGVCTTAGGGTNYASLYSSRTSSLRLQAFLQVALAAYLSGKPVDIFDNYDTTPTSSSCIGGATGIIVHN